MTAVGIVGPGRAGGGLGFALSRAGHRVFLHGRSAKNLPVALEHTWGGTPPWISAVDVVFLAVPDDAIGAVAVDLAESEHVTEGHAVLHLSGVLDRAVLEPLAGSGAALGSFHPLQSFHDPLNAPEQLKGSVALVEGDDRAVRAASDLGRSLGLHPVPVPAERKAAYHAAELFLSSFVVVLAATAEDLLAEAGVSRAEIWRALSPVLAGTMEHLKRRGTRGAFAGPVARGETEAVRRHLDVLSPDGRALYRALVRAALELADLPEERKRAIEEVVAGG